MTQVAVGDILGRYARGELKGGLEGDIEYLPPGVYDVEVIVAKVNEAKGSIFLLGSVQAGPYAGKKVGLGQMSTVGKTEESTQTVQRIFAQNLEGFIGSKDALAAFASTNPTLAAIAARIKGGKYTVELIDNDMPDGTKRNQIKIGQIKVLSPGGQAAAAPGGSPVPQVAPAAAPAATAVPAPPPVTAAPAPVVAVEDDPGF